MSSYKLAERACLMRLSAGMPGKARKDRALSEAVKGEHSLGRDSGAWVKQKFPKWALEPLEKKVNEARQYHAAVTLPFDQGIGILPAALIMEYGDRMRQFRGEFEHLRDSHFRARYDEMIEWAKREHNGTFDASDYPAVEDMMDCFQFRTEVLPMPEADHFAGTIKSLLGVDAESVDQRVADAMTEGMQELLKRMIDPVTHMAHKLSGSTCTCRACKGKVQASDKFKDSLTDNILEIANLVPKLNISGDPQIDQFAKEMAGLANYSPEVLRKDKVTRSEAAKAASAMLGKLTGYKL